MDKIRTKIKDLFKDETKGAIVKEEHLQKLGLTGISLRPYQLDGVNWLRECYYRGHGSILGDEMGLGKTCQTISFLVSLGGGKQKRHHLILSPLSVVANWQNELKKFAPHLKTATYMGSKESRESQRSEIKKEFENLAVVLTTYEIFLKDEAFFKKYSWCTLVVDEAHRLKNRESLLHQVLLEVDVAHRVLLTGTPVQNNLKELYSLLCFVAPKVFREKYLEDFEETFADVSESNDSQELHKILKPFIIRRIKNEVVKDLPKKSEVILYHDLSTLQKKYYKAILTKDLSIFENPHQSKKTTLMNTLMQLRKCVNHPYLFDGVEPEPFQLGEHLVEASGKLVLIDQLLSYLKEKDHKVLMFSQMTHMLDIIQDYLGYRGYTYERLDGSVRGEERFLAVKNFNESEETFVFLLSTRAGGQGLNLVSADTVIFVDSDFNPQNDLQAAARAHRIGQTRPVKIIRLINRNTVEELILKKAEAKLKLTNTVIEGGQFSLGTNKESKEAIIADDNIELSDILKFGVDKLFSNDETTSEKLDLEAILGKSSEGQWKMEVEDVKEQATLAESMDVEDEDEYQNMYLYEGKDYSKETAEKDDKVIQDLIVAFKTEESSLEGRALRRNKTLPLAGILPDINQKRPRKQLTDEEKEARRQKIAERAALKAKQAEERELRKQEEAKKRKEAKWKSNDYETTNFAIESETEDSEDEEAATSFERVLDEDEETKTSLDYVVGDVTQPQNTGDKDAIIVHCVDDSGRWGQGGLFSAISSRSLQPQQHYSLAAKMEDLALGDAHVIPVDDIQSRENGNDYVALVVAQHRDRKNNLSGIKLSALNIGLERIYRAAKKYKASVHLPRIGHNTPGFNWYGTERLIKKLLTSRGVHTSIYYFPRKNYLKRARTDRNGSEPKKEVKKRRDSESSGPSTSRETSSSPLLSDFLQGVIVYFYEVDTATAKKMTRYVVAYDGDVEKKLTEDTTHVVVDNNIKEQQIKDLEESMGSFKDTQIVKMQWLEDCLAKRKKLKVENYLTEAKKNE